MTYQAPVKDMLSMMNELASLDNVAKLPDFGDAITDMAQAVLKESARFTGKVVASLNIEGDCSPSSWRGDVVTATADFKEAFTQLGQGGWQGVRHPLEYDDQGLSKLIATVCIKMPNATSLSFALYPLLTDGAIEVLLTAGTEEQKQLFVPKLISGE